MEYCEYLKNLIKIHEKEVYENYGAKILADTDVSKKKKIINNFSLYKCFFLLIGEAFYVK